MRAIINGFRYDTDKATLIGSTAADCSTRDFSYWEAGLYKTPRAGRYFLAGEGGPMTQFANHRADRSISSGERIIPMTEPQALEWATEYLSTEIVEHYFGHMIEDA